MSSNMTGDETFAKLSELLTEEFLDLRVPGIGHIETLPYAPVLNELAKHCGDCRQCIEDGDGETTCEEALVLEYAGRYAVDQQFITSLLN